MNLSSTTAGRTAQPPGRSERTAQLLGEAHACADPDRARELLDEVVVINIPVATAIASRYRNRGVPEEDLRQVACMALTKSVQRYNPQCAGEDFLSFAVPTVRGEVRRYFRDQGWTIRPTRRMQELQAAIFAVLDELHTELGRSPRPRELADRLGEPVEAVHEALALDGCFQPTSLETPVGVDGATTVGDLIGNEAEGWAAAEARLLLGRMVRNLGERDRRILYLRFFEGRSQREIAEDIGVTQMQVSRLLTRIMRDLRCGVGEVEDIDERAVEVVAV